TRTLQWHQIFSPASSLAIDFSGTNNAIRNTQFGAQRVKDAIVDQLRDSVGSRPEIDSRDPDVLINARLSKGQLVISF
ncbi:MAG: THUMP domain-containing protein, partial [bacterium]